MTVSTIKATIHSEIDCVWKVVLAIENYNWRSDLSKTERINEKRFLEYSKKGYPTAFTITASEPYRRWEFDMENSSLTGHWAGIFTAKGEETEIVFTECVRAKKFFLRPFLKYYLKKQQMQFVSDLEKQCRKISGTL